MLNPVKKRVKPLCLCIKAFRKDRVVKDEAVEKYERI